MKLFFFKCILSLIILTQLWCNVIMPSMWIFGDKIESLEFINLEEKESEQKEEKKEKEFEDKLENTSFLWNVEEIYVEYEDSYFLELFTLHISEINSPPPKL